METKKILWVRLDAIGDNILSASMLPYIFEKYGGPEITVVCQSHISELYEVSPYVSRVIGVDEMKLFLDSNYRNGILQDLRNSSFDVAMNASCFWRQLSDLFVVGSLAKEKIAFENSAAIPARVAEKRGSVFTSLIRFRDVYEPEVDKFGDFLEGLGIQAPRLGATVWTSEDDEAFADRLFSQNDLDPARTVALFAFGRSHLRTYPFYGVALHDVCAESDFSVIALGDDAAYGFNQKCLADIGVRSVNLSGKTTLRQSAALLRKCRLAVGAETGLAHMACAVGVPNVVVMGGGHFGLFMPYSPLTSVAALPLDCYWCGWTCSYEYSHCVVDVAPEVVEFAVRETLRLRSEKPRVFLQSENRRNPQSEGPSPGWKMPEHFLPAESIEVVNVELSKEFRSHGWSKKDLESALAFDSRDDVPQEVAAVMNEASALRSAGEPGRALAFLEMAVKKNPKSPDLLNLKGELEIEMGFFDQARETLFHLITYVPFHLEAINNIALIDILQKRYDSALGLLKKALEIDPSNGPANANLAFIQNELSLRAQLVDADRAILDNDLESARVILDGILAVSPTHEDALSDLAVVEARQGHGDEALRILQTILAANPASEFAMQLMEKLLFKSA